MLLNFMIFPSVPQNHAFFTLLLNLCERNESCAFLHRQIARKDATEDNANSSKEKYKIVKLKGVIKEMNTGVEKKVEDIEVKKN